MIIYIYIYFILHVYIYIYIFFLQVRVVLGPPSHTSRSASVRMSFLYGYITNIIFTMYQLKKIISTLVKINK